jgi:hypothetical protein
MLLDDEVENTFDKSELKLLDAKFLLPWHGQRRDDTSVKIILNKRKVSFWSIMNESLRSIDVNHWPQHQLTL